MLLLTFFLIKPFGYVQDETKNQPAGTDENFQHFLF